MSFSLYMSNLTAEQMMFAYSAAHETMVALHVFVDPKHHPLHISWVIQARRRMTQSLKEEIECFRFLYGRPIVDFWVINKTTSIQTFRDALNELQDQPIEYYIKRVMESLLEKEMKEEELAMFQPEFLERAMKHYPSCQEAIVHFLEKPKENRERFLSMLEAFWDACLKAEWPKIETQFLEDITTRGTTLLQEGPLHVLKSLSPEIEIDPDVNRVVIRRLSKGEFYFSKEDHLCLAPTYFAWPHLFVRTEKPIGINYPIMAKQREAKPTLPSEDLMTFFRALGDLTRFQMMSYLSEQPRSTQELASLIGITEGAISKHLKKLEEVGLISPKRQSYYVFYVLNKARISELQKGISHFI